MQEYKKALGDLDFIIAIDPSEQTKVDFHRAVIYEKMGDLEKAKELLNQSESKHLNVDTLTPASSTTSVDKYIFGGM